MESISTHQQIEKQIMAAISEKDVISAAIHGVEKAQHAYERWSGGYWLWKAPEYLTTVSIAQEIESLAGSKYITLENGTRSALEDAGAKGRGRLHSHIRENGRFDILLWWANEAPRAPIEVKVQVTNAKKIHGDVLRIEKTLHRKKDSSSFAFGMLVYYISLNDSKSGKSSAAQKIQTRADNILNDVKATVINTCQVTPHMSDIHTENGSAWAVVVLIFKPLRTLA